MLFEFILLEFVKWIASSQGVPLFYHKWSTEHFILLIILIEFVLPRKNECSQNNYNFLESRCFKKKLNLGYNIFYWERVYNNTAWDAIFNATFRYQKDLS